MEQDNSLEKMTEELRLLETLLKEALQRVNQVFKSITKTRNEQRYTPPQVPVDSSEESYLLRQISHIESLGGRILYIKSDGPYVEIRFQHHPEERPLWLRIGITKLTDYLPQAVLLRISRSVLVNPKQVLNIHKKKHPDYEIALQSGSAKKTTLTIGRTYLSELRQNYPQWFN